MRGPRLVHCQPNPISGAVRLVVAMAAVGPLGCLFARPHSPFDCDLNDPPHTAAALGETPSTVTRSPIDLSGLKLYRNTFFVDRVGPYADHFSIWYGHIEPNWAQIRAQVDSKTGRVHVAIDYESWGSVGTPLSASPPPEQVADLQRALERELPRRCPDGRNWIIRYDGRYREVDLTEMMVISPAVGPTRIGWHGTIRFAADETLTHAIHGVPNYTGGYGNLGASEPLQWVDFVPTAPEMGMTLFVDRIANTRGAAAPSQSDALLTQRALEAARRLVDSQPSQVLSELLETQGSGLLPAGVDPRLWLDITLYARPRDLRVSRQEDLGLSLPLKTSEAVHAGAQADASGIIAGMRVKATASLVPLRPLASDAPAGKSQFEATLHVHIEDEQGHALDASYPAKALLFVDGRTVATGGFALSPGQGEPAPEQDVLSVAPSGFHGTLPGRGPFSVIDVYVWSGVSSDPRRR